jgi:hypothetical protein
MRKTEKRKKLNAGRKTLQIGTKPNWESLGRSADPKEAIHRHGNFHTDYNEADKNSWLNHDKRVPAHRIRDLDKTKGCKIPILDTK